MRRVFKNSYCILLYSILIQIKFLDFLIILQFKCYNVARCPLLFSNICFIIISIKPVFFHERKSVQRLASI